MSFRRFLLPASLAVFFMVRCAALPAAAGAASPLPAQGSMRRSESVLVTAVPMGDAVQVQRVGRVRLLGVVVPRAQSPTADAADIARKARQRLASLVLNRWIRLEWDSEGHQSRAGESAAARPRAAYVMTEEGTFVNAVLVRDGLARVASRGVMSRRAELERAQAEARAARHGLWSAPLAPASQ